MTKTLKSEFSKVNAVTFGTEVCTTEEFNRRSKISNDDIIGHLTSLGSRRMPEDREVKALETIRSMVVGGADVNKQDEHGHTPLLHTVSNTYPNRQLLRDVSKVLVEHGAKIEDRAVSLAKLNGDKEMAEYLKAKQTAPTVKVKAPALQT